MKRPKKKTPRTVEPRAIRLREFARAFGVSYDSVRRAMGAGQLKTIRFGNLFLVPMSEVERVEREGLRTKKRTQ